MVSRLKLNIILGISFAIWLAVMGVIYRDYYIRKVQPELGYFSSDITFKSEERQYFKINQNGSQIGYRVETQIYQPGFTIFHENNMVKLNLAGMSREVFLQCVARVDSGSYISSYMEFTIQSGNHMYTSRGRVHKDSLYMEIKINDESLWRRGIFSVNESITYPVSLPFFMHKSETDTMTIMVYDPVIFTPCNVNIVRGNKEKLKIGNETHEVVRYDMSFSDKQSSLWLNEKGKVVKSNGYIFFGGELGHQIIERSTDPDLFRLPERVTLGNDLIRQTAIYPDRSIPYPRNTSYLEIQINNVRAGGAHIDIDSSNKELISFNPLILGIHNKPVIQEPKLSEQFTIAVNDTAITGTSDYIQSKDARIVRAARNIVSSETDTLEIARKINQWVFSRVIKDASLDNITRSIDILRQMRGNCDEHTKLFTALSRSLGIPTQINLGLIYKNGAFRYHSWPSVLAGSVWHDLDPTLGQDNADATHIALVRGDFERLVELLRIINRISINIHDLR
ncbi:transglutaminase family protein [Candidatus Latescibacterota bacterium]